MEKKTTDFKHLNIGLVLAGGGAKGAYEAGVFQALWELELEDQISVISGTSVGAVNALLLSMNDRNMMKNSWGDISYSRFIRNQEKTRRYTISKFIEKIRNNEMAGLLEQLKLNDIGLLSQNGIKSFIEEYVDMKFIKQSNKTIYACCYNIDDQQPEYFKLNDYSSDEITQIVLASCAVPYVFRPIVLNGKRYADGGIKTLEYSQNNVDNVPLYPIINHCCDLIIVVHLSYRNVLDKSKFDENKIVEIFPSSSLEYFSGVGTIYLKQDILQEHIEMGYRDAMVVLAPMVIRILKQKEIHLLIRENQEKNRKFQKNK